MTKTLYGALAAAIVLAGGSARPSAQNGEAPTIAFDTNAKAGAYTVVAGDSGKTIDCTATPWTLGLTTSATLGSTFICVVRNLGTGDLTIDPAGTEPDVCQKEKPPV